MQQEQGCSERPLLLSPIAQIPCWQGAEGVNDKKKFVVCSHRSLSAGISEAEFDKMAAEKFSMCRLEVKCN